MSSFSLEFLRETGTEWEFVVVKGVCKGSMELKLNRLIRFSSSSSMNDLLPLLMIKEQSFIIALGSFKA